MLSSILSRDLFFFTSRMFASRWKPSDGFKPLVSLFKVEFSARSMILCTFKVLSESPIANCKNRAREDVCTGSDMRKPRIASILHPLLYLVSNSLFVSSSYIECRKKHWVTLFNFGFKSRLLGRSQFSIWIFWFSVCLSGNSTFCCSLEISNNNCTWTS